MISDFAHPDPSEWDDYTDYQSTELAAQGRAATGSSRASVSTASRRAGSSATSTRRRSTSARSKATRSIRAAAAGPARRAWSRRISWKIPIASSIRCGATASADRWWRRVTWDEALADIGGRMRRAIQEGRRHELMYHVGRPGEDGYANRVLQCWGIDGATTATRTSVPHRRGSDISCGPARTGRRPTTPTPGRFCCSPLTSSRVITSIRTRSASSKAGERRHAHRHRSAAVELIAESGPLAARLLRHRGALLLAIAKILLDENLFDREFVQNWVNWQDYLAAEHPGVEPTFDNFIAALRRMRGIHAGVRRAGNGRPAAAKIVEAASDRTRG